MDLRTQLEAAQKRAYSLKTKKAQTKAFLVVRELRDQILNGLYEQSNKYAKHSVKATVRVAYSGDDSLFDTEYGSFWISPANDELTKSWYEHTSCIEYTEGQSVVIEFDVEVDSDRLCIYRIPKRVYGGRVNEAQYAELCKRDDLAFFKYPNSTGVTGLFKQTAVQGE